ncbi:hypothetical protein [uncultured Tateyamaria sp.]|uniref:hypothetical protein n=1 Tax=Tateyamaria sp. 1078 TaxID=3417464 RepID=UPI00261539E2|nr:hypothetical protein [uncultured Tateyamaria sp.]
MPAFTPEERTEIVLSELEPLKAQLQDAGVECRSATDQRILTSPQYALAIPIIIRFLQEGGLSDRTSSAVAGLLTGKGAALKAAWPDIVALYKAAQDGTGPRVKGDTAIHSFGTKTMLANAVMRAFSAKRLPELLKLVQDTSQGETRIIIMSPLKPKRTDPEVAAVLERLRADPQMANELATWPK